MEQVRSWLWEQWSALRILSAAALTFVYGSIFTTCVFLYFYGVSYATQPESAKPFEAAWFWLHSGYLGLAGVGGLATTLFTRYLGTLGAFRKGLRTELQSSNFRSLISDEVAKAVHSMEWLDRRSDILDLWRAITIKAFMPGFQETSPSDEHLTSQVDAALRKLLKADKHKQMRHYVKDVTRTITVSWANKKTGKVQFKDSISSSIIPFDPSSTIFYYIEFTPTAGGHFRDYAIEPQHLEISGLEGNLADTARPTEEELQNSGRLTKTIELSGQKIYKMNRETNYIQSTHLDPIFICDQAHLVQNMTLTIVNQADGLSVSFQEIGVEDAILPNQRNASPVIKPFESKTYRCDEVLLPHTGFILALNPYTEKGTTPKPSTSPRKKR